MGTNVITLLDPRGHVVSCLLKPKTPAPKEKRIIHLGATPRLLERTHKRFSKGRLDGGGLVIQEP